MYRNAGRGIVDLCRDLTSEEVFVVDIATVSSRLEELFVKFVRFVPCSLFLLLIPLCRPSVIRWCIWRYSVSGAGLDHVQRWGFVSELAFQTLTWESDASIPWRKISFERKNAFNGKFGLPHLLEVSLCFQVGVHWSFELQELSWSSPWTVICNIHNCNRYLFLFRTVCLSFWTGRSILLLWPVWMDNPFTFEMCFSWGLCNAVDASNHTLDRDCNFLFCSWNTEDDHLSQMDFSLSFKHIVVLLNCLFQLGFLIAFPFFCRVMFEWTCSCCRARAYWHPRSTIFAFFSSAPFEEYAAALFLHRSFLRNQLVLLSLIEDVIKHELILLSLLLRKEPFQELNFDASGQFLNSNFSASFLFEVLSPVTDRVSDKAVEVDGNCSHGLPAAARNGWNGESLFLSASTVANNPFLIVVHEQMSNARRSPQLSSSCFVPPLPWQVWLLRVFQESQAVVASDISLWREVAYCCALITAGLPLRFLGNFRSKTSPWAPQFATGLSVAPAGIQSFV